MRQCCLSDQQARMVIEESLAKFNRARIQAGEAVGVATAHSLGEPATQMTLKTFHFAGVASMNVTLGVPRITEVINANVKISTPIITACLLNNASEVAARIVKARVEKTTLGEVCVSVREVFSPKGWYVDVRLDMDAVDSLHLGINVYTVANCICAQVKPRIRREEVHVVGVDRLYITTSRAGFVSRSLVAVAIQGIPEVQRAIIAKEEAKGAATTFKLLIEGKNLLRVMGTEGVDAKRTTSNDVIEVEQTLGIEAARTVIMRELLVTYTDYGIELDKRHLTVLADTMTYKGMVLGITRFGIEKMKDSVLGNASFEKTPDHLFTAAAHSRVDDVNGVSACIIMGSPMEMGTGCFKLLRQTPAVVQPERRKLLLK